MQMELKLLGDPKLRNIAQPAVDILSEDFQRTVKDLKRYVLEKGGMGIAAPQVGINERFFIMSSHPNERYPYAPEMPITAIINPEIVSCSEETQKGWEGCLSVPSLRGNVPRHKWIKVRYFTENNECVETKLDDFLARIFQHELDHLDGVLFTDRLDSTHDLMNEKEWYKQIMVKDK